MSKIRGLWNVAIVSIGTVEVTDLLTRLEPWDGQMVSRAWCKKLDARKFVKDNDVNGWLLGKRELGIRKSLDSLTYNRAFSDIPIELGIGFMPAYKAYIV